MTLEHKAFLFDSEKFCEELKPILEKCLLSGDVDQVRAFVLSNKSSLTDPYEGEPLEADWEDMIEDRDVHQYGDFALTKYYSPALDIGLGADWEILQKMFANAEGVSFLTVLGEPLGADGKYFDPGKMGSYFQTPLQVVESLKQTNKCDVSISERGQELLEEYKKLLEKAATEHKGLYVTF